MMLHKFFILFSLLILTLSCNEQPGKTPINISDSLVTKHVENVKPGSSFNDTLTIFENSAVFYLADSLQLLAIKKITDTSVFKSQVHENFYQMRYSKIVFKKYFPNIKLIEANKYRYLKFIKKAGQAPVVDLNTKNDAFGLIVFDGLQEPRLVDMTNIETELGFYFKKK
jgi:hypothetical protein